MQGEKRSNAPGVEDAQADSAAEGKKASPPLNARDEWVELFRTTFIAIILAMLVRTFALEPFNIPSGSMMPTLQIGDYLFVSKPAYGYSRFSFPFGLAPIEGRVWTRGHAPQRGDIVVFKLPTNTSIDFIKRVIGLPGDTIQVTEGRLYINHKKVDRGQPLGMEEIEESGTKMHVTRYLETLPNGLQHFIYEIGDDQPLDNTSEYVVPAGHYFMMGDNRDNSQDSRVLDAVGYVPLENVVGRASFLFFSTNGYAYLPEVWKWPWSIRFDRMLKPIRPVRPADADQTDTEKSNSK